MKNLKGSLKRYVDVIVLNVKENKINPEDLQDNFIELFQLALCQEWVF